MRNLLLISCSKRKIPTPSALPALQRYDGNTYRLLRKLKRQDQLPHALDILILSAEYGLIDAQELISDYNRRLTRREAIALAPIVSSSFQEVLSKRRYESVYIDLGKDYLPALGDTLYSSALPIHIATGRVGERLKRLKGWLISLNTPT